MHRMRSPKGRRKKDLCRENVGIGNHLNQIRQCKSRTRWVIYCIDHGDVSKYHPLPLLETVAAVV